MLWFIKKPVQLVFIALKQEKWPGMVGLTAGRGVVAPCPQRHVANGQGSVRHKVNDVVKSITARLSLGRGADG